MPQQAAPGENPAVTLRTAVSDHFELVLWYANVDHDPQFPSISILLGHTHADAAKIANRVCVANVALIALAEIDYSRGSIEATARLLWMTV